MWGRIDTSAPAWLVINGTSRAFASLARMGFPMQMAGASIRVGEGFEIAGRARFESPAKAQQLAGMLDAQIGAVKAVVDTIDVAADDRDIKMTVTMSQAQVEALVALAGFGSGLGP
jgi:hypothetical protein